MNPAIDSRTIFDDAWRAPIVPEGSEIIFDEPGRIANNIDFSSHYFRCTRSGHYGPLVLHVKHGGGEESVKLGYGHTGTEATLAALDSDARYLMLHQLYSVARDARTAATERTSYAYKVAFAEGRLKKRKLPRQNQTKVWVEGNLF